MQESTEAETGCLPQVPWFDARQMVKQVLLLHAMKLQSRALGSDRKRCK